MKIYFNRQCGSYGCNNKSGTQSFIDKFYKFCNEEGIKITNNINDIYDLHFVLCLDDDVYKSKEKGIPILMRLDGMYSPACGSNWKQMNDKMIEHTKLADHVIFLNEYCLDTFSHFAGWTPENITFISNGCDTEIFKRNGMKELKNNILVYGENRRPNQIKPILDAMPLVIKEFPDTECHIVGGGNKEVLDLIPKKSYFKQFGRIKNFDLPKYAHNCSIAVCPGAKLADHSAVSEVLCCEVPIICYDNGGVHFKVKDAGIILKSEYYGWDRFPNENPQELANAIIKMLNNKHEYILRTKKLKKDLNLETMKNKYINVIKKVINEYGKIK